METIIIELQNLTAAIKTLESSPWETYVSILILPIFTIIFSIYIAAKQNSISLFERRYQVYLEICKLLRLRKRLTDKPQEDKMEITINGAIALWKGIMDYEPETNPAYEYLTKSDPVIRQINFLFAKLNGNDLEEIRILRKQAYSLVDFLVTNSGNGEMPISKENEKLTAFIEQCDKIGTAKDEIYIDTTVITKDENHPAKSFKQRKRTKTKKTILDKMEQSLMLSRKRIGR